jgi:membrane associated rhomboid family serine protease
VEPAAPSAFGTPAAVGPGGIPRKSRRAPNPEQRMRTPSSSLPTAADARAALIRELRRDVRILVGAVAVLWAALLLDAIGFRGDLLQFGIVPRTLVGLRGLAFGPLLHAGVAHLAGNTAGLVAFGGLVLLREEADFWWATGLGAAMSGVGTWLVGRAAIHVGASGIVFAYFGYLLFTGVFERRLGPALLSAATAVTWGSLVFGVLPGQPGISWELHLFGLAGGAAAALLSARQRTRAAAASR